MATKYTMNTNDRFLNKTKMGTLVKTRLSLGRPDQVKNRVELQCKEPINLSEIKWLGSRFSIKQEMETKDC